MGQDVSYTPIISNDGLEVMGEVTYLSSTIASNLSLDVELNKRIGKAVTAIACLGKRAPWENTMPTTNTIGLMYSVHYCTAVIMDYVLSTERRLETFHMRCLWRILGITWNDRVPKKDVLVQEGMSSIFSSLSQRRLRWLGHVSRMDDGRIPKDILYG